MASTDTLPADADKGEQIASRMEADGVDPTESMQTDYFGFEETHQFMLPDDKSFIEHRSLNEGGRRKYMNAVNRDVRLNRATGDVTMKMAAGDDRSTLLLEAITGWNLVRDGKPVVCNRNEKTKFLEVADPSIIDLIERDVRDHNPWLLADVTEEDIDAQIEELEERRAQIKKGEEGKDN